MDSLKLSSLQKQFDDLQQIYGEKTLDPIVGAGCISRPKLFLVFMNPTARNVASSKQWSGLKAPWLGTKHIWKMLYELKLFDPFLVEDIYNLKPEEWDEDFSEKIYKYVAEQEIYITNLAKCTQVDARPLPNSTFAEYLPLIHKEIAHIKPRAIITFGNQVSSLFLEQSISVSRVRKQPFLKNIGKREYITYSLYYPVGQGMRNMPKAKEDLTHILNTI